MMNVCWVAAHNYTIDPTVDIEVLKSTGPIWGSWTTWRSCATDNVICHSLPKAQELVDRSFQTRANFFTHKDYYADLGRPAGVRLYGGNYNQIVINIDDIIALHLAASTAEIVLLLGFDFGEIFAKEDRFDQHKITNQHGLTRGVIVQNPNIQWVAVDHAPTLDKSYQVLSNLTCDNMSNVLKLLA